MSPRNILATCSATLIATILAASAGTSAFAQSPSMRAEIDAIKAELVSLQAAAATSSTVAQAVQELSSKLVVLEQELAKHSALGESMPAAVDKIDALESEVHALRTELEYLRTGIANIEQPAASGGGGIERDDKGWTWVSSNSHYSLKLGGYFQPRYETQLPESFDTQDYSTFKAKRARIGLKGALGERLSYAASFELASASAPLRDMYMDMRYREELSIRVGQTKVPYSKSFLASSTGRDFIDLGVLQERQRYDRDMGVWAMGSFAKTRVKYQAGISNGSGGNKSNDNVDMALSARVEGVVLGKYIAPGFGDYEGSSEPRLTLGAAVVHDLVRVPETISGIEVGNRDVDGNGVLDNVRAISSEFDAQFRYKGYEGFIEGTYRHERWGTILKHEDNADLASAVRASDSGHRNYLGFSAQASYFILPHRLQAGARISHGRLPLLGIGGLSFDSVPPAQRLMQTDVFVQLWRESYRRVGMTYSFLNYNEIDAPDPANDKSHIIVVEAQLVL